VAKETMGISYWNDNWDEINENCGGRNGIVVSMGTVIVTKRLAVATNGTKIVL